MKATSKPSDERATPWDLFHYASEKWGPFTLDACATAENAKVPVYYSSNQNGLIQPWTGRVWVNCPYSRGNCEPWIERAVTAKKTGEADLVCLLLPAATSNKWWQRYWMHATWIEFLPCRIRFGDAKSGAFFSSAFWILESGVSGTDLIISTYRSNK